MFSIKGFWPINYCHSVHVDVLTMENYQNFHYPSERRFGFYCVFLWGDAVEVENRFRKISNCMIQISCLFKAFVQLAFLFKL